VTFLAVHDIVSPPQRSFSARAAVFGIDQYRVHISPRLRRVVTCRFTPTCSAYGREAIRKYGLARGGFKTAVRIARCGPWTRAGTIDRP
jgi:putative membrane protein insertion efficiency factor